jgi:hypothetical protein
MRRLALIAVALVAAAALALAAGSCGGDEQSLPTGQTLTVQEALESTAEGPLSVRGTIIAPEGAEIRLCSAILESYPPQCGEPSLVVEGLDLDTLEGLTSTEDPALAQVTWSEQEVTLVGTVDGGVLTVG